MPRKILVPFLIAGMLFAFPAATSNAVPRGMEVQTYRGSLNFPVDMAWVPGTKKIFFTEKNSGKVRVMRGRRLLRTACVNLDVDAGGESGALGIALHPRFKRNHYLYVFYTNASPHENRVSRFTVTRNRCRDPRHIITGLPASTGYHNGGQLEFMAGKLFVSTGENHQAALAQDTNNRLGKILRVKPNGDIPDGNPFGALNPVWSYGHRNPFGLAHKPGTAKLFETENGPGCDDEVNRIIKGRNYGWGSGYRCDEPVEQRPDGPNPVGPLKRYESVIVPTDAWWYTGRLKRLRGLLMGDFGTGRLHRFVMNDRATRIRDDRIVHDSGNGIIDVAEGPGRWIYFLTSTSIMRIVRR